MVFVFVTVLMGTLAMLLSKAFALSGNSKKVLLKNVNTLTLRKDKKTSHRRVSAIPQLKCIGGEGCSKYQVEVMRCENAGSDYDEDRIQWTCRADVPEEFKLGSTDVRCEGYSNPRDPFILKGSCGVEYRLLLTDKGTERYGGKTSLHHGDGPTSKLFAWAFWLAFFAVVFIMARSAWRNLRNNRPTGARGNDSRRPPRPPFDGGDGGGGAPWFGGDGNDPPPPYTPTTKPTAPTTASSSRSAAGRIAEGVVNQARNFQPGFWTGAAGGAAATYFANRGNRDDQRRGYDRTQASSSTTNRYNTRQRPSGNGEGSSSSPSYSPDFHTSTGFGSTSNR